MVVETKIGRIRISTAKECLESDAYEDQLRTNIDRELRAAIRHLWIAEKFADESDIPNLGTNIDLVKDELLSLLQ